MTERYFKVLDDGGEPRNGGKGAWDLPTQAEDGTWTPGEWREIEGKLELCWNALHAATVAGLLRWLGPHIYEIEYSGKPTMHADKDKVGGKRARLLREYTNWNERTTRLLACDIAEDVLPLFEKEHPNDSRPRQAIEVARLYADGKATQQELAAASDAAWVAAGAAAWAAAAASDAAWAAAGAAARDAASDAAWAAAGAAAWAAAGAAAWAAAWAATTEKYTGWLLALLDGTRTYPTDTTEQNQRRDLHSKPTLTKKEEKQ